MASQREKRVTAGNKLRSLLDQESTIPTEQLFEEEEGDEEFKEVDEADIVDSDFEDTDEEDNAAAADQPGDQEDEDALARKRKRDKIAASVQKPVPVKKKRPPPIPRELGGTGSDLDPLPKAPKKPRVARPQFAGNDVRKSNRTTTVVAGIQLDERLRANRPAPKKVQEVLLTQEELLEEAKQTEEVNKASLYYLQQAEEERRNRIPKRQQQQITGPSIHFLSFVESKYYVTEIIDDDEPTSAKPSIRESNASAGPGRPNGVHGTRSSNSGVGGSSSNATQDVILVVDDKPSGTSGPNRTIIDSQPTGTDRIARNVFIFDEFVDDPFVELKKAPPKPGKAICPITGLMAKYRDPVTGTPYATIEAYKVIKDMFQNQRYLWSPFLKSYIHPADARAPSSLPPSWKDSTLETGKSHSLDGGKRPLYFGLRERGRKAEEEESAEEDSPITVTFGTPLPTSRPQTPIIIPPLILTSALVRQSSASSIVVKQEPDTMVDVEMEDADHDDADDGELDDSTSARRRSGKGMRGRRGRPPAAGKGTSPRRNKTTKAAGALPQSTPDPEPQSITADVQASSSPTPGASKDIESSPGKKARKPQTAEAKERAAQRRRERNAEKKSATSTTPQLVATTPIIGNPFPEIPQYGYNTIPQHMSPPPQLHNLPYTGVMNPYQSPPPPPLFNLPPISSLPLSMQPPPYPMYNPQQGFNGLNGTPPMLSYPPPPPYINGLPPLSLIPGAMMGQGMVGHITNNNSNRHEDSQSKGKERAL
ncbi:hypothetical protein SmJEL517_g00612 [Synchytrium microbalum]|uniref:Vps72/YL1 C-terminal domain-containing protein n=1 Tax=Synchytrium microbalum TaxID=1806994 RepID=A0A507C911_9FUNG|nr:uncharacterized protein SmJEL517_g00612 [Synchytrium microbalum]TPX37547.1 hypothetical protein SmJEL517_g00612 [Synchytrium microbalum]